MKRGTVCGTVGAPFLLSINKIIMKTLFVNSFFVLTLHSKLFCKNETTKDYQKYH